MGGLEKVPEERKRQSCKLAKNLGGLMVLIDLKDQGIMDSKRCKM